MSDNAYSNSNSSSVESSLKMKERALRILKMLAKAEDSMSHHQNEGWFSFIFLSTLKIIQ